MPKRNARQSPAFSARLAKAHEEFHAAFNNSMKRTACTQGQAARGMGVNVDTIRNYMSGRTPVNTARVRAFPRLRKPFFDEVCSFDHGHGSVPYVLKKHRGSK